MNEKQQVAIDRNYGIGEINLNELEDKFYFDGKLLAKVFKDLDGDYGIWYSNDKTLYLGAVKLLADWEIAMYEKFKRIQ
ncbi:TPA: hypothetical protein IX023_001112 [Enterococcus faecium]|nr:hypothetical protein [Enterococcus faecium]